MDSKTNPSLSELELESRRVLVRINTDVPVTDNEVTDPSRIRASLATINYLVENGARVILMGHRGNPAGNFDPSLSLEPVAVHLAAMSRIGEIYLTDSCVGDGARSVIQGLREGQICLLENLGFHVGEMKNDDRLARQLASFCDIYVNESFSLSEMRLASTCAITRHARLKTTGLQFASETTALRRMVAATEKPFVFLLGGDVIDDQMTLLDTFFDRIDSLIIGGSIATTFEAARGGDPGRSRYEKNRLPLARDILERAARRNMKVILPTDVTVRSSDAGVAVMSPGRIPADATILDAGPQTIAGYRPIIGKAGAILWSGRFGTGEGPDHMDSSTAIARAIAGSSAFSLAIGQGVVDTIRTLGLEKGFDMVCTGETAAMRMLEGKTLPALAALGFTAGKNR